MQRENRTKYQGIQLESKDGFGQKCFVLQTGQLKFDQFPVVALRLHLPSAAPTMLTSYTVGTEGSFPFRKITRA